MILEHSVTRKYLIKEEGKIQTSMGEISKAIDMDLKRTVAVKRVHIEGDRPADLNTNRAKAEFEVKLMLELEQDEIHIPRIYDFWYNAKTRDLYIVMEWVYGETLHEKMGNMTSYAFLSYMKDLCIILEAMSRRKLYHKDIKPENIMITKRGTLYLIDFNISLSVANLEEGTEFYRAPEMERGSQTTARDKVDMFAIGVMMYQFYAGHLPKKPVDYAKGSSFGSKKNCWAKFKEPKDYKPDLPKEINDVIVRCMKYAPNERYSNIQALRRDLEQCIRSQKGQRRPSYR